MNLKQLEAFVRVAETKNFSAAARQLFLTQPTVSAHIAALEKELNTCLLVRSTKGVALSESGKELYAYAEQMLELEQKIRERFGLAGRQSGSVLRIAASTIPAQYLLPGIMAQFRGEYPEEQLKLFETDSGGVIEMIKNHKAVLREQCWRRETVPISRFMRMSWCSLPRRRKDTGAGRGRISYRG